jgi:hypothetical protein
VRSLRKEFRKYDSDAGRLTLKKMEGDGIKRSLYKILVESESLGIQVARGLFPNTTRGHNFDETSVLKS